MPECKVADECPDPGNECLVKACTDGQCVPSPVPAGTPVASNVAGDCKNITCDGSGATTTANDDNDLPVDGLECTDDVCSNGVASNPPLAAATACGTNMDLLCDGNGACVGCLSDSDCGAPTDCTTPVCNISSACETQFVPVGTPTSNQTTGDCQEEQCNGLGATKIVSSPADVTSDGKSCTADTCVGTTSMYSNLPTGTACAEGTGKVCDGAGECVECLSGADCSSFVCVDQACLPPTCMDNVKNGTETDKDCGGSSCSGCANGKNCNVDTDCTSTVCNSNGKCVASICNDGRITGNETCDDGNDVGGDGCSDTCKAEPGYGCTGEPSVCVFTCGDGVVETYEPCDDGNLNDGDGCSSVCREEPGYDCSGAPSVCVTPETNCGDGIDNNGDGQTDSADQNCQLPPYFPGCEPGDVLHVYRSEDTPQPIPDQPIDLMSPVDVIGVGIVSKIALSVNITHPNAGDVAIGLLMPNNGPFFTAAFQHGEDGDNFTNTVFDDFCSPNISTVTASDAPFSACYAPLVGFFPAANTFADGTWTFFSSDFEGSANSGTVDDWTLILCGQAPPVCGNGFIQFGETCDDMNTTPGDGCSDVCAVEPGYLCSGEPSVCVVCTNCESEPNDFCGLENPMTLSGMPPSGSMHGAATPQGDLDYYTFTLTDPASNVTIETFVGGIGQCFAPMNSSDTVIELDGPVCGSYITDDDDGGIGLCSRIDAGPMPAGTYWVLVRAFGGGIVDEYEVVVTATP